MASSGSYARGDQPRSVPDNLKGPYEEMSKKQKAYNAKQEEAWYRKHPGLAESLSRYGDQLAKRLRTPMKATLSEQW